MDSNTWYGHLNLGTILPIERDLVLIVSHNYTRKRKSVSLSKSNTFNILLLLLICGLLELITAIVASSFTTSMKLQSHLLEAKEFSDRHTGNNIAEELPIILDKWGLKPEVLSAATTDNGSNIVLAMEILKCTHMRCFTHNLHLAVDATLNLHKVSKAVSHCRCLVNLFCRSYKSSYLLRQKQKDLTHDQH